MPSDDVLELVDAVEHAVKTALAPVVGRLRALETSAAELAGARERIAALEAREPVPGPPGPPGPAGADGVPGMTYRGPWDPARRYAKGDVVTIDGSMWHANTDTERRPGDGSGEWTLAVKRGRDRGRP